MNLTYDAQELGAIATALEHSFRSVELVGHGRWRLIPHESTLVLTAWVDEGWLLIQTLETSPRRWRAEEQAEGLWELLRWNGVLPGGVKFGIRSRGPLMESVRSKGTSTWVWDVQAQTEIPIEENAHLAARVSQARFGFDRAVQQFDRSECTGPMKTTLGSGGAESSPIRVDLQRLVEEAGWPSLSRQGGGLWVDLDVWDRFYQASVECEPEGIRMAVNLSADCAWTPEARQALAILLLRACAQIRFARAVISESANEPVVPRFEVVLAEPACASEVSHALSALSIACRLCGGEVKVLQQDVETARAYLALHGTVA